MKFTETSIAGVWLIDLEPRVDERGYFARTWCEQEFATNGLSTRIAQANTGVSPRRGTLRGMHYQESPHAEVKVIRCTRGSVHDVVVDLRPESPTHGAGRVWNCPRATAVRCTRRKGVPTAT